MTPLTPAHSHRRSLVVLVVMLALTALALRAPIVAAQDAPLITFRILVLTCDVDPGVFPEGEIPSGCTPVAGAAFSIVVAGGDTLTCTSNADGRCQVEVPSESQVTVTEDTATIPAGFTPRENPIATEARNEFAGAVFVNLADAPAPAPTEPPTTQLPDTGTGSAPGPGAWLIVIGLAILAGTSAVTGRRLRR